MDLTRYDKLRSAIRRTLSPDEAAAADRALEYAAEHTASQVRHDGSPMLDHAAEVARIGLEEIGLGGDSVVAAILHDVVRTASRQDEETFLRLTDEIRDRFGKEVLGMTVSLSHISDIRLKASREQAENFRELIVSYSEDPRVILIKLADRLEVMRRLEIFPREKWRKKSWESLNLYAQIAHKLGLYNIKSELEDIALRYLEPQDYQHIADKLAETESERRAFIARVLEPITQRLDQAGLRYHVKSRTKSIFSIWNKMHKQHVPFEGVYDIFAIRIIIDCPQEAEKQLCWTAYSVVTDFYTPNPKRMRDWISIPKSNGYESLHTTVSAEGRWVEVQIRTERMDAVAERGIAAHWRYKGVNQGAQTSEMWLGRLRELLEDTTHSLAQRFDAKPASGEIFVFTPNGDLRKLPEGASLLDFAFDIHTSLGSTCVGGKVNNRTVSIREQLHNGDIVEILTQKNQTPKSDWLNFVVTSKARNKIKSYLREEQAKHTRMGREELERKLKNWKFTLTIDEAVAYLVKHKTQLGVVYNPVSDECFYAQRGQGAYINGRTLPLRSVEKNLHEAIAGAEIKYLRSGKLSSRMNTLAPVGSIRSLGSSTLDWCYLAAGRYDVYVHGGQKLWDYAAGALIFEEAGGCLATLEGDDFWSGEHVFSRSVVAAMQPGVFAQWLKWIRDNQ